MVNRSLNYKLELALKLEGWIANVIEVGYVSGVVSNINMDHSRRRARDLVQLLHSEEEETKGQKWLTHCHTLPRS